MGNFLSSKALSTIFGVECIGYYNKTILLIGEFYIYDAYDAIHAVKVESIPPETDITNPCKFEFYKY